MSTVDAALAAVTAALAGSLREDVVAAGEAAARLRWHPALRRRADEVHAEVLVRAAASSAALEGARAPADLLRLGPEAATGGRPDPALAVGFAALRAQVALDGARGTLSRSPAQALARAHSVAAGGLVPDDALGRPRAGAAPAVAGVAGLLRAAGDREAPPGVVTAALAQAEIVAGDLFSPVSGLLGRAVARTLARTSGLDPLGVTVPEAAAAADPTGYRDALAAYAGGDPAAAVAWVGWWARAVTDGAATGEAACEAVLRGAPG